MMIIIKNYFLKIKKWIYENPLEFGILVFILVVASICRLYRISEYMTFLGDEGRDVIVVRRLLTQGHPPLIGPGTSIGNMYLGPLYYYMMAIPLLLANYNPVGPAIQIAILGVITVWFVWYVGRIWFNKTAGLIAAGLFAISPTVIIYSRSSWNPNIMPFFSLLSMYSIWKVWRDRKYNWLIVMGIAYAFVLQSHYLGLLLAPTIFIYWLLTLLKLRKDKKWLPETKEFIKKSALGLVAFLVLMSPLFFFDLRHDWINTKALYTFLTVRQETVSIKPWSAIPKFPEIMNMVDSSVVSAKNMTGAIVASVIIFLGILWVLIKNFSEKKNFSINPSYWFLISWLGFGLVGFGLYKQNIYDHYFGFLFVVPFLLIGPFVSMLLGHGKILKVAGIAVLGYFVYLNIVQNPLRFSPNFQMQRARHVAEKIVSEDGGRPLNFGVISDHNYEDGYSYFLELDGATALSADDRDPSTISDQLFVVCELGDKCDPTHSPKAQIAHFGMTKIDKQWTVDGVIIYRLIHTK